MLGAGTWPAEGAPHWTSCGVFFMLQPVYAPSPRRGQWFRCAAHGIILGATCPYGCSAGFVQPANSGDPDIPRHAPPMAMRSPPPPAPPPPAGPPKMERSDRGTFLPLPPKPETDDESMTDDEVRSTLKRILSHLPRGAKRPFAKLCGFGGKWYLHSMKSIAKGEGMLVDARRRKCSRTIRQVMRGEWVLVRTGCTQRDHKPFMEWVPPAAVKGREIVPVTL
jgi:hypothetical protein